MGGSSCVGEDPPLVGEPSARVAALRWRRTSFTSQRRHVVPFLASVIGTSRQTLIADTGPPSLTHMASTIFLHGAHDQGLEPAACAARSQVGVGGRSRAVGRLVNALQTKLQCTIGGGRAVPVLYGLAYSLLHTWNTDR